MKKSQLTITICLLFSAVVVSFAQDISYELHPSHTKKIQSNLKNEMKVYEVKKSYLAHTYLSQVKKPSNEYLTLKDSIQGFAKDSIRIARQLIKETNQYLRRKKIIGLINSFTESNQPYTEKKIKLIEAQKLADKIGLPAILYADEFVNKANHSEFLLLKKNSLDLKIHLKRIVWDLEKNLKKPETDSPNEIDIILRDLRKELANTEKSKIELVPKKTNKKERLIFGDLVKPELLFGTYRKLGEFKILAKDKGVYLQNELVAVEKLKKTKISLEDCKTIENSILIVNEEEKNYFLVPSDFLEIFEHSTSERQTTNNPRIKEFNKIVTNIDSKPTNSIEEKEVLVDKTSQYSLAEYEGLISKCQQLTKKMMRYNRALRNENMTSTQNKEWKRDIIIAQQLNERIKELNTIITTGEYSLEKVVDKKVIEEYENFKKTLLYTTKYAGF